LRTMLRMANLTKPADSFLVEATVALGGEGDGAILKHHCYATVYGDRMMHRERLTAFV